MLRQFSSNSDIRRDAYLVSPVEDVNMLESKELIDTTLHDIIHRPGNLPNTRCSSGVSRPPDNPFETGATDHEKSLACATNLIFDSGEWILEYKNQMGDTPPTVHPDTFDDEEDTTRVTEETSVINMDTESMEEEDMVKELFPEKVTFMLAPFARGNSLLCGKCRVYF